MSNQVEILAKLLLPEKMLLEKKQMDTQNALKIESPEFSLTKISLNSTLLAVYENSHPIVGIQLTRRELVTLMGLMDYYYKNVLGELPVLNTELEKKDGLFMESY